MLLRILSIYGNVAKRRPLLTQVVTAGVLTTAGDILAQKIENRPCGYDIKRTVVMSTFGFCYFGPIVGTWLGVLRRLNWRVLPTVVCDQLCFRPFLNAAFIFMHPILSGKDIENTIEIFKTTYFAVLISSWLCWAPAQYINFAFVPFQFRMLYIQFVALTWNSFLSYFSNHSLRKAQTPD
ncbi:unnamed protein product [Clavelina lepadiformis]|uniref:Mitochondrial inner membrane protein Mpv17 n=1 Tax=Clavelina lepadiformis TaxID=159417 RepID=A0ABP0G1N6_CLALP